MTNLLDAANRRTREKQLLVVIDNLDRTTIRGSSTICSSRAAARSNSSAAT
ncbi:MAG: hypothetical protein IPN17_27320 [Deltaproteobacteria bacterium]|nr:hypothetical protein [Deltaproteobacteria bacterium]